MIKKGTFKALAIDFNIESVRKPDYGYVTCYSYKKKGYSTENCSELQK